MMNSEVILIVEDNDRLRKFMASSLKKAGYENLEASSVKSAFKILQHEYVDLVLLDLHLGDSDGIDILRTIRRQDDDLPVIIVSSISDQEIKLDGFGTGCDDYITKPFYVDELLCRVKRLLNRYRFRPASVTGNGNISSETIYSGPFSIDIQSLSVSKGGQKIEMRKKLFDIFLFFIRHPDRVLSSELIFDRAWTSASEMNENSIYVHIRHLRRLIEDDPAHPAYIKTVRGEGYRYTPGKAI